MHGLLSLLFTFSHDAHKIALYHHRAYAIDMGDGFAVYLSQGFADEIAMVGTCIGWAHHPTMQHAWHAHVMHIHQIAKHLGSHVDTRRALANGVEVCSRF